MSQNNTGASDWVTVFKDCFSNHWTTWIESVFYSSVICLRGITFVMSVRYSSTRWSLLWQPARSCQTSPRSASGMPLRTKAGSCLGRTDKFMCLQWGKKRSVYQIYTKIKWCLFNYNVFNEPLSSLLMTGRAKTKMTSGAWYHKKNDLYAITPRLINQYTRPRTQQSLFQNATYEHLLYSKCMTTYLSIKLFFNVFYFIPILLSAATKQQLIKSNSPTGKSKKNT